MVGWLSIVWEKSYITAPVLVAPGRFFVLFSIAYTVIEHDSVNNSEKDIVRVQII